MLSNIGSLVPRLSGTRVTTSISRSGAEEPGNEATTLAYVYTAACAIHVTIFSTGGKFRLVSNFTELHTLTLAIPVLMCSWFASIG